MSNVEYIRKINENYEKGMKTKVNRYRDFTLILAVIIHIFAFISGTILLVVYSLPIATLLVFHGTLQILAYLHIYFGPKIYEKQLRKKVIHSDELFIARNV